MNLISKTLFTISCSILISQLVFAEEKNREYSIYIGFSAFKFSETDGLITGIGEETSILRFLGIQFTNRFAFEIFGGHSSPLDPKKVFTELKKYLDRPLLRYRIKTEATTYLGGLGVFTFKPQFVQPYFFCKGWFSKV